MTQPLLALSVRQPWAYGLVQLGKPVENRDRRNRHRGVTLIHASAGMTAEDYEEAVAFMVERVRLPRSTIPAKGALQRGGIIGAVEITDCVDEHPSRWFVGTFAFVCTRPRPLPFMPCKGTISPLFWAPPMEVQARAATLLGISH